MNPNPTPMLALAVLLIGITLAGCSMKANDATPPSVLHIDFGGAKPTVDSALVAKLDLPRPADPQRDAAHAAHPAFYTAFDQIEQWSSASHVPVEVSYDASFGFFLAKVDGLPTSSNQAFWSLTVNQTESQVGMEQVHVAPGSRIAWTLTSLTQTASQSGGPTLHAPARVETRGAVAFVNGTAGPGAKVTVRGGPGAPVVQANGTWSYRLEPSFGRTNLTFTADDGAATRQAAVLVVRLAAATFEAKYTMAVPPHGSTSDTVWFDPDEQASAPMYAANKTTHPAGATVHDVMVTWTRQTGTHIAYTLSSSFGFGVEAVDGVGAPLSNGTPPYWCYKLNGDGTSVLGISAQTVKPGDDIAWEFAGCT